MASGKAVASSLALSVHGPGGVLDLVVSADAPALDVARAYAAQCRLTTVPVLHTRLGRQLRADGSLAGSGVSTGDLLVAAGPPSGPVVRRGALVAARARDTGPGQLSVLWFCVAGAVAVLAGWFAVQSGGTVQDVCFGLLLTSAFLGVLPGGRFAEHRLVAAPVFAGAAALVVTWAPEPERLPSVFGVAALVAAVSAAVARSMDRRVDEATKVWIIGGVVVFLVATGCALLGTPPQVVWSVLLLLAMLAARLVPGYAVDVPDQLLIDIERLAVTAWSARERPTGRRGRTVVPSGAVDVVAARGARLLTAAAAAVLAVTTVSAPLLLATAVLPIDRIGARVQVVMSGAALLLAARSYRHVAARALLRLSGVLCLVAALVVVLGLDGFDVAITSGAVAVAALLVVVAVATGRGWRSAWWSRRAEVAEGLAGAMAIGALVVAVGIFRTLWE